MLAEAKLKDGRYVNAHFKSEAKTWKRLCKSARRALSKQGIAESDIALLRVNGNAE